MLRALYMFFFLPSQRPSFVASPTGALAIPYDNCQLCVLFTCVARDTGYNEKANGSECSQLLVQIPGSPLMYLTHLFKFTSYSPLEASGFLSVKWEKNSYLTGLCEK